MRTLLLLALVLTGCEKSPELQAIEEENSKALISITTHPMLRHCTIATVEHDGHRFVVIGEHGGIIHHPSCKCLKP